VVQLDVDPDMVRETADEQVRFLVWQNVVDVADEFIEAFLVLLDRDREGKTRQLGEAVGVHRRAEPLMAQVREAIPGRYTLVDLQGVVPRLGDSRPSGGKRRARRGQPAPSADRGRTVRNGAVSLADRRNHRRRGTPTC
jgi:hypothetical protein